MVGADGLVTNCAVLPLQAHALASAKRLLLAKGQEFMGNYGVLWGFIGVYGELWELWEIMGESGEI